MWNYRVVRKKSVYADPKVKKERVDYTYAIHEAYYDKSGHVEAITQDPVEPFGENIEELRRSWVMMAEAFGQPILEYDNIPEPEYVENEGAIGSVFEERRKRIQSGNTGGISRVQMKRELEEANSFDEEAYRQQVDEERVKAEKIHGRAFIGTPTLEELITKLYSDYREHIQRYKA